MIRMFGNVISVRMDRVIIVQKQVVKLVNMFNIRIVIYVFLILLGGCQVNVEKQNVNFQMIDFGNLRSINLSKVLKDISIVELETNENSLFGTVNQIAFYNNKIYLLDTYQSNALFAFSMKGKFLGKIERGNGGPGEFMSPHSFYVDSSGIYVLDRGLDYLLNYDCNSLQFKRKVPIPQPAPLSFLHVKDNSFIYFYPLRKGSNTNKQYVLADDEGFILDSFYEGTLSGKILHGNPANFYWYKDTVRTYPYFSNCIYTFNDNSLTDCFHLSWGDMCMPNENLFTKYESSGTIMEEILRGTNDWIRLLYVYETDDALAVKYYVKRDLYFSAYDKQEGKTFNLKADKIVDDLGIGGVFPLPLGTINNYCVSVIYPGDVENVSYQPLRKLLKGKSVDSNPILMFYKLDIY